MLSASEADTNGVTLVHPVSGEPMSFVAHEVKLKGISGKINDLYLDFVGFKYDKNETFIDNPDLDDFLDDYLYEAVLKGEPGTLDRFKNIYSNKRFTNRHSIGY